MAKHLGNRNNRRRVIKSDKNIRTASRDFFESVNIYLREFLTHARTKYFRNARGRIRLIKLKECWHILLFPLFFVYCEILLRIFTGTGVFKYLIYPVLFGFSFGFALSALTSVFPTKINRIISAVILCLSALLFSVECLVKKSFNNYMTVSSIFSGAKGVMTEFTADFFRAVFTGIYVIALLFLPFILYLIFSGRYLRAWQYRPYFAVLLFMVSLLLLGAGTLFSVCGSAKNKYRAEFEFDTGVRTFGLLTGIRLNAAYGGPGSQGFVYNSIEDESAESESESETAVPEQNWIVSGVYDRNLVNFSSYGTNSMNLNLDSEIASETNSTIKQIDEYVNSLTASGKNPYTGLFEGKNLIMICAEAFCDTVVDENLTPTLYRLIHNGFYFSDYYQPAWGGSTITGEASMLLGLVPLDGVETFLNVKDHNLYFTLGNQLQRKGYYSAAYHNGEYYYYDRQLTHENLGYSIWLGQENGLEDITGDYPSDAVMFDKTMDTYINEEHFSVYYMTIDGHCTYDADNALVYEYLDQVIEATDGRYKDKTNYYLCYQMGLEAALTVMVEKLEAAGIADDTVICLTGDHYPYGLAESSTFDNYEDYLLDLFGYNYFEEPWYRDHNSLIIWSGCLENEESDIACEICDPTSSLDIVPTLSNLFGLEFDSRLLAGRDVFSDADPLVLWTDHSWITDKGRYDSDTGEFTSNDGVTVSDDYVDSIRSIVQNKITFSDWVLDTDYYGVLFGEDTVK